MALKAKLLIQFIVLINLLVSCNRSSRPEMRIAGERKDLVVAMDMDMPGYFAINGENFGYQYDLLNGYAADRGLDLKLITGKTSSECEIMLRNGEADLIASLSSNLRKDSSTTALYATSYTVLSESSDAKKLTKLNKASLVEAMRDKRILISYGFKTSRTYDAILDSLVHSDIFVSSRNCFEMLESLRDNVYDFVICEKSEAQLGGAMVKDVVQIFDFPEVITIAVSANPTVEGLQEDFENWLSDYRKSNEYAMLNYLYFEKGLGQQIAGKQSKQIIHHNRNSISDYDKIMREVCEREGYDWRLLSAIAFHESRFNAHVVSKKGALGLMQIMPSTARQFNVDQNEILKPEVNIMIAARLIRKIESMLKFPKSIDHNDKMSIVLACYNCGIGHVLDARKLADKYGANPNSWEDVSLFLQMKSHPEYSGDEVVRCGSFQGSKQTLAFVNNVMGKYNAYCAAVTR